jgi:hypothetical protein
VARARYENGQPLSEIFRWFDYVLGAELEMANNAKTVGMQKYDLNNGFFQEGAYVKWGMLSLIHAKNFIEREFDLRGKISSPSENSPSHSALTCASYFSQFYYLHDGSNNQEILGKEIYLN